MEAAFAEYDETGDMTASGLNELLNVIAPSVGPDTAAGTVLFLARTVVYPKGDDSIRHALFGSHDVLGKLGKQIEVIHGEALGFFGDIWGCMVYGNDKWARQAAEAHFLRVVGAWDDGEAADALVDVFTAAFQRKLGITIKTKLKERRDLRRAQAAKH